MKNNELIKFLEINLFSPPNLTWQQNNINY